MDNYTNRQDTSPSRTARTLWQRLLTMLVLMTVIVTGAKANGWEDKDAYFKASFDNNRGCFVITIRQGDDRHGPALENGYIKMTISEKINTDFIMNLHKILEEASGKSWKIDTVRGKPEQTLFQIMAGFLARSFLLSAPSHTQTTLHTVATKSCRGIIELTATGTAPDSHRIPFY